ncbi:hypothetical protein WME76_02110 [Sorangium sp. So ce119]|uniref:hypothetical protein n=1 Tax=Sorangium sp. So ce119 TaxID=3133279 RepID=UPI003F626EF5
MHADARRNHGASARGTLTSMSAAESVTPAARRVLADLVEGSRRVQAEAALDDTMAALMTIANIDIDTLTLLNWDEQEALEEIQRYRTTIDWLTGPVGSARRRAVQALAPHRAAAFEQLEERVVAWYREAVAVLEDRVELIRASNRIMEEHEPTYRALAQ